MAKWTDEEINILKNNMSNNDNLHSLLPNRTIGAIESKKKELELLEIGIKKDYSLDDIEKIFEYKNYDVVSMPLEIKNKSKKIKYICRKHADKGEQSIDIYHLYQGRGCYYCGREKSESSRRILIDKEYDKKMTEEKGFKYIDTKRENGILIIYFICPNHKEIGIQSMNRSYILNKASGCQYCHGHTPPEWYVMDKIKKINPYMELLEPYENLSKRILCRCNKHDYVGTKSVQEILAGRGCKFCGAEKLSEKKFLTDEEVQARVSAVHPHIKLIEYKGMNNSDSTWFCKKHNKNFSKTLSQMLRADDSGCDLCYKERMWNMFALSHKEFEDRLKMVHPNVSIQENYKGFNELTLFYCSTHNFSFISTPADILKRISCCPKSFKTYKEEQMCLLLENWGFSIERQKKFDGCKDKTNLKFDCFLIDYNTVIEYDGENHFHPVKYGTQDYDNAIKKHEYTVKHDVIKNNFCKENNINMIRIPYYKFDDMEYFLFDELSKLGIIEEIKIA